MRTYLGQFRNQHVLIQHQHMVVPIPDWCEFLGQYVPISRDQE